MPQIFLLCLKELYSAHLGFDYQLLTCFYRGWGGKSKVIFFSSFCFSRLIWKIMFSFPLESTSRLNYRRRSTAFFEGTC